MICNLLVRICVRLCLVCTKIADRLLHVEKPHVKEQNRLQSLVCLVHDTSTLTGGALAKQSCVARDYPMLEILLLSVLRACQSSDGCGSLKKQNQHYGTPTGASLVDHRPFQGSL